MLMQLLSKAATVAMLSFVVSSMLAMGAGLTVSQISEPLRNVRLVVLALLANFVVMPLGALALAKVLGLDEPFGVGLCCSVVRPERRSCRSSLNWRRAISHLPLAQWCC